MTGNPQPLGGNEMPRFAGIATFMRLPGHSHPSELDVAVVGVPFDIGTSNRPGARFGTGTPEIAGLTTPQALEIVRGCRGLDLVGCDLVEVAPIYDVSGMTAHIAADLVYEMLCVLPGVQCRS